MTEPEMPWKGIIICTAIATTTAAVISGIVFTALGAGAVAEERERTRYRWTDENRW